jgi:nitrate reductase NapE
LGTLLYSAISRLFRRDATLTACKSTAKNFDIRTFNAIPQLSQVRWCVQNESDGYTKPQELRSFLFLTAVMAPVLTVIIVAGYGFIVWFYQLLAGPPGS